jgi:hypothetical protein
MSREVYGPNISRKFYFVPKPLRLEVANHFPLIFVDDHTVDHAGLARVVIIQMDASARFN